MNDLIIESSLVIRGSIRRPGTPELLMKEYNATTFLISFGENSRIIIVQDAEFDLTEYIKKNFKMGVKTSVAFAFFKTEIELFNDSGIRSSNWSCIVDKFSIGDYKYQNPECPYFGIGQSDVLMFNGKSFYEIIWDNISRDINETNIYLEIITFKE